MQIHEITKLSKINEGLLDTVKAAAKGVGQELAQRHLGAQPKQTVSSVDDLLKSRGIDTFEKMLQYVQANPTIKQQIKQVEQQFLTLPFVKDAIAQATANPAVFKTNPARTAAQTTPAPTPATNATMARVAAQNRQMSPAVGIKEAAVKGSALNALKQKKGQYPTAGGVAPSGIGDDIDQWVASKVKGYSHNLVAKFAPGKMDSFQDSLVKAINSGNQTAIKQALENYLMAAKAGTMLAVQKQKEISAKNQRAEVGDIGDWEDANGDGIPDAPVSTNPQVNQVNKLLQTQGVQALKDPKVISTLKTTGILK